MDAQMVTEPMVDAAHRILSGVMNRERIRVALREALAVAPKPEQAGEIPVTAHLAVHLVVDEQQLRAAVVAAVEKTGQVLPVDEHGVLDLAALRLPLYAEGDAQDRRDAEADLARLGVPVVREPVLNPALEHPLELGSLAAVGRRLGVSRSTVTGWVKTRESNGMPTAVDGNVYDLVAVERWYRAWKGIDDAAAG